MMRYLLQLFSSVINLYSFLCFVRIILTWIPGMEYSAPVRFLSAVCDPFLNLFRGAKWLRVGALDFSPAIAIGVLYAAKEIVGSILFTGRVYIGGILAILAGMLWSVASSLMGFLFILLLVRLAALLVTKNKNYHGSIWAQMDYAIEPVVHFLTKPLSRGSFRQPSYTTRIVAALLTLAVATVAGQLLMGKLISLLVSLPF